VSVGESAKEVLQGLADGPHRVVVKAFDRAANHVEATLDFKVDTSPLALPGSRDFLLIALGISVAAAALAFHLLRRRREGAAASSPPER
jgi:hypothetical protein